MELLELYHATLEIFGATDAGDLSQCIMYTVLTNQTDKYEMAIRLWPDLNHDWMQKIFQYYQADRDEKKQDFTPPGLALFMASFVAGEKGEVIDLCAGSGALTIQAWTQAPDRNFTLYELDEKVIPYLLFNLAVRNINATVYHGDILSNRTIAVYSVCKGKQFATVARKEHEHCKSCEQPPVQHEMDIAAGRSHQLSLFAM